MTRRGRGAEPSRPLPERARRSGLHFGANRPPADGPACGVGGCAQARSNRCRWAIATACQADDQDNKDSVRSSSFAL